MNIAVIGDYQSPQYKNQLQRLEMALPEEHILDLSSHRTGSWKKMCDARFEDIFRSHKVIIGNGWRTNIDARRDITYAQSLKKECLIEIEGVYRPFPEYAREI